MKKSLPRLGGGFTLVELLITITIIGILSSIGFSTFSSAQRKAKDTQRKNDLITIAKALEVYNNDYGLYPTSDTGQIKGCTVDLATEVVCAWGASFQHANTEPDTIYLIALPDDPSSSQDYYYEAAGDRKSYQLYARLENIEDSSVPRDEDDNPQVYSNTVCGTDIICNFGVSSSNTTPATNHPPEAE